MWDRLSWDDVIARTKSTMMMVMVGRDKAPADNHLDVAGPDETRHRVRAKWEAGDRLWVREAWQYADWTEDGYPFVGYRADEAQRIVETAGPEWSERLTDIWATLSEPANFSVDNRAADPRWRPGIHMPRWASRITLEVTEVRVQRVQKISEEDAKAEGVRPFGEAFPGISLDQRLTCGERAGDSPYRASYAVLWDELNADRATWKSNPYVWAISFTIIKP